MNNKTFKRLTFFILAFIVCLCFMCSCKEPSKTPVNTSNPLNTQTPETTVFKTEMPEFTTVPTEFPKNTPVKTVLPSESPDRTPEKTQKPDNTPEKTSSPTQGPSFTPTATITPEKTPVLTPPPTPDFTQTPDNSPDNSPENTPENTPVLTPTPSPTPDPSSLITPSPTPYQTPVITPVPTPTLTPSPTPENTPEETPVNTPTPTPENTPSPTPEESFDPTPSPTPTVTPEPTSQPLASLPTYTVYEYARSTLSDEDKIYYDNIKTGMLNYEENISISIPQGSTLGLDDAAVARLKKIGEYVLADHPEIFWYSNSIVFQGYGAHITLYKRTLLYSESEILAKKALIESKALDILNYIRDIEGDYEVSKALYKYIIRHTKYNLNAENKHSIYSVLANGDGVCDGYTKTFQYLLNFRDIKTIFVWGYADGGYHAWCLLNNENNWYQCDLTWGDPTTVTPGGFSEEEGQLLSDNYINYQYFNLTDSDMAVYNHIPAVSSSIPASEVGQIIEIYQLPQCTSSSCNFYIKENLLFSTYDFDDISDAVESQIISETEENPDFAIATLKFTSDIAWADFKANFSPDYALTQKLIQYKRLMMFVDEAQKSVTYILFV